MTNASASGRTRSDLWRRTAATFALLATVAGSALGCSPEPTSRFLTQEEAETIATARFRNFEEGTREVSVRTASPDGSAVGLHGYFDYTNGAGIAQLWTGEDEPDEKPLNLVWWSHGVAGELTSSAPAPDTHAAVPVPDPDAAWEFFSLDPVASPLMAMLFTVANLGFDRPENPKLLEQSDALWLGTAPLPPLGADEDGIWFQLPSADEVRSANDEPQESSELLRILTDAEGRIWEAERTIGGVPSTISYGRTEPDAVPSPSAKTDEQTD